LALSAAASRFARASARGLGEWPVAPVVVASALIISAVVAPDLILPPDSRSARPPASWRTVLGSLPALAGETGEKPGPHRVVTSAHGRAAVAQWWSTPLVRTISQNFHFLFNDFPVWTSKANLAEILIKSTFQRFSSDPANWPRIGQRLTRNCLNVLHSIHQFTTTKVQLLRDIGIYSLVVNCLHVVSTQTDRKPFQANARHSLAR
jgi:hypothetical protein